MSRLVRTPKSASDWTRHDLNAYRISVEEQDAALFFGVDELPEPNCPQDFLRYQARSPSTDETTDDLLWTMVSALGVAGLGEGSVDQFARSLLRALGFTSRAVCPLVRRPLELLMGGESRSAQTDVCLVYGDTVLLLVQENKVEGAPPGRGEAQLIAEAIAARQFNVAAGAVDAGLTEVMPAILLTGTYPAFYRIPVSAELDTSIGSLGYPEEETRVARCTPRLPRPGTMRSEGMVPLDNRSIVLGYFEAFRRHVFIPCSEATLGVRLPFPS
jgi:hypothetical protein